VAFADFVESARLDTDQQETLGRILALHYENERNLSATAPELELAASMQRQLLHDTRAQLRARLQMSDATWEGFEHSGLLSVPAAEEGGDVPAPERGPT
jgi:hypothetical protein